MSHYFAPFQSISSCGMMEYETSRIALAAAAKLQKEVRTMRDENCIFCKIANGEIPSSTVYEDEEFRVILDLGPASKGHALDRKSVV